MAHSARAVNSMVSIAASIAAAMSCSLPGATGMRVGMPEPVGVNWKLPSAAKDWGGERVSARPSPSRPEGSAAAACATAAKPEAPSGRPIRTRRVSWLVKRAAACLSALFSNGSGRAWRELVMA